MSDDHKNAETLGAEAVTTVNRAALIDAYQQAERAQLEANASLRKANDMLRAAGTAAAEAENTVDALRAILQGMP